MTIRYYLLPMSWLTFFIFFAHWQRATQGNLVPEYWQSPAISDRQPRPLQFLNLTWWFLVGSLLISSLLLNPLKSRFFIVRESIFTLFLIWNLKWHWSLQSFNLLIANIKWSRASNISNWYVSCPKPTQVDLENQFRPSHEDLVLCISPSFSIKSIFRGSALNFTSFTFPCQL
jgi:hypothetical protein